MKIKVLKENMFSDSRDWKSIDDFEQWNLSQVRALAKYRKGEGKFDYDFYEEVYADLKYLTSFLDDKCTRIEAADNHYWWREKLKNVKKEYREGMFRETAVWRHGVEYFLHRFKLNKKITDLFNLKVTAVNESRRTKSFGTKVLLEYLVCSQLQESEKERLKDALQNMEKLRKTYPFKLKHLPTFTRMAGLEESSSMGGGAVQGHAGKKEDLEEMYSSAAIMGSGGGGFPKERSPEGHKRYVRIRFKRQGLQNFKPNRYFRSKDQQLGESSSEN